MFGWTLETESYIGVAIAYAGLSIGLAILLNKEK